MEIPWINPKYNFTLSPICNFMNFLNFCCNQFSAILTVEIHAFKRCNNKNNNTTKINIINKINLQALVLQIKGFITDKVIHFVLASTRVNLVYQGNLASPKAEDYNFSNTLHNSFVKKNTTIRLYNMHYATKSTQRIQNSNKTISVFLQTFVIWLLTGRSRE